MRRSVGSATILNAATAANIVCNAKNAKTAGPAALASSETCRWPLNRAATLVVIPQPGQGMSISQRDRQVATIHPRRSATRAIAKINTNTVGAAAIRKQARLRQLRARSGRLPPLG